MLCEDVVAAVVDMADDDDDSMTGNEVDWEVEEGGEEMEEKNAALVAAVELRMWHLSKSLSKPRSRASLSSLTPVTVTVPLLLFPTPTPTPTPLPLPLPRRHSALVWEWEWEECWLEEAVDDIE